MMGIVENHKMEENWHVQNSWFASSSIISPHEMQIELWGQLRSFWQVLICEQFCLAKRRFLLFVAQRYRNVGLAIPGLIKKS